MSFRFPSHITLSDTTASIVPLILEFLLRLPHHRIHLYSESVSPSLSPRVLAFLLASPP